MNPLPFVRLPNESPLAFEAFITWFNLKDRKLKNVAEAMDISFGTIRNWSSEFCWADRFLQHKARLIGSRAEAEIEVAKKQALAKADLIIELAKDRAVRIQEMKDLKKRLTDEYVLHNSDKTRLSELTGLEMAIAKLEQMDAALLSKTESSQSPELDSEFEAELLRAYGDQAKPSTPPPDDHLTDAAGI